jgi:hypothetical protein
MDSWHTVIVKPAFRPRCLRARQGGLGHEAEDGIRVLLAFLDAQVAPAWR